MKNKTQVEEIQKKIDKVLGGNPGSENSQLLMKALLAAVNVQVAEDKESFRQSVRELKVEDRKNLERIVAEIKKLKPEKIEEIRVHVLSQPDFPKEIKVSNFPKYPEPLSEIGIKEPNWFQQSVLRFISTPIVRGVVEGLGEIIVRASGQRFRVKLEGSSDPQEPIAVRLSDGKQFYKAVMTAIAGGGGSIFPFATSTGQKKEALVGESGRLQVDVVDSFGATNIGHGVKVVTTAGTDVALAASAACLRVTIQAQTDNTGLIAVGGAGVDATEATGTGFILYPGDGIEIDIDNLADIYIDSTVNGDGVRYSYLS